MSEIDLNKMLQAAQELQGNVAKMQEELAKKEVEASSGGGMVTATVNGHFELTRLAIEKDVVDPADVAMLQDLVVAAVNQAIKKARDMTQEEMAKLTGGLGIPGMPGGLPIP